MKLKVKKDARIDVISDKPLKAGDEVSVDAQTARTLLKVHPDKFEAVAAKPAAKAPSTSSG